MSNIMDELRARKLLIINIVSGALIPTLASIVFNILNFYVDAFPNTPFAGDIQSSVFDVSAGCVFAMVGLCVGVKTKDTLIAIVIAIALMFILIVFGDLLYFMMRSYRVALVVGVDLIAFSALCWAIFEVVEENEGGDNARRV